MAETNVEQLHVIKDTHRRRVRLSTEAIDFLIEQTERVPELENDIEVMSMVAGDSANELVRAMAETKHMRYLEEDNLRYLRMFEEQVAVEHRLREALEKIRDLEPLDHVVINQIAREALEGLK